MILLVSHVVDFEVFCLVWVFFGNSTLWNFQFRPRVPTSDILSAKYEGVLTMSFDFSSKWVRSGRDICGIDALSNRCVIESVGAFFIAAVFLTFFLLELCSSFYTIFKSSTYVFCWFVVCFPASSLLLPFFSFVECVEDTYYRAYDITKQTLC